VSKKKKVRVAFKKNRQKRTRANDLTQQYRQDRLAKAEPPSAERTKKRKLKKEIYISAYRVERAKKQ